MVVPGFSPRRHRLKTCTIVLIPYLAEMTVQNFSLKSFPAASSPPPFRIDGTITRRGHQLAIRFALRGPLTEAMIPPPADLPARRHGLWEATCFEFFLGVQGAPGYWEVNLSPAGHWNIYRFQEYRRGMAEETAFRELVFTVRSGLEAVDLIVELDLGRIIPAERDLEAAIAAVLRLKDGGMSYWALAHPGPQADFHRRDSFILKLPDEAEAAG